LRQIPTFSASNCANIAPTLRHYFANIAPTCANLAQNSDISASNCAKLAPKSYISASNCAKLAPKSDISASNCANLRQNPTFPQVIAPTCAPTLRQHCATMYIIQYSHN
jgi:hypothetical protein